MSVGAQRDQHTSTFADGVRAGIPFAVAGGLLSISFGVVAQEAGLSAVAVPLVGVATFTVGIVAGQAVGGLVVDRVGLKRRTCECYAAVEGHFAGVIGGSGTGGRTD